MQKLLSVVTLFLMSSWASIAWAEIGAAADVPVEKVDVIYVILFGVVFFGMIIGYAIKVWRKEKQRVREGQGTPQ